MKATATKKSATKNTATATKKLAAPLSGADAIAYLNGEEPKKEISAQEDFNQLNDQLDAEMAAEREAIAGENAPLVPEFMNEDGTVSVGKKLTADQRAALKAERDAKRAADKQLAADHAEAIKMNKAMAPKLTGDAEADIAALKAVTPATKGLRAGRGGEVKGGLGLWMINERAAGKTDEEILIAFTEKLNAKAAADSVTKFDTERSADWIAKRWSDYKKLLGWA